MDKFREYGIAYTASDSVQTIDYCPWCADRLPPSLRTEWFDRFERNVFLQDREQWECEHEEYRSGKWWENDNSLKLPQPCPNNNRSETRVKTVDASGKCCERMMQNLDDDELPFAFFSEYSLFAIVLDNIGNVLPVTCCPWCGVSLSNSDNESGCSIIKIPISNTTDPRTQIHGECADAWNRRNE